MVNAGLLGFKANVVISPGAFFSTPRAPGWHELSWPASVYHLLTNSLSHTTCLCRQQVAAPQPQSQPDERPLRQPGPQPQPEHIEAEQIPPRPRQPATIQRQEQIA